MSSEEKIKELTERIEKLEKAENRRVIKRRIEIGFSILKVLVLVGVIIWLYTIIKPYKEKIDMVSEKVDTVENFVNDKVGGLSDYFFKK